MGVLLLFTRGDPGVHSRKCRPGGKRDAGAERHIVARVRKIIPAYRVISGRVRVESEAQSAIAVMMAHDAGQANG